METEEDKVLLAAILVAAGIGIAATMFFLYTGQDSFSVLSIAPDSIIHNPTNNTVSFTYQVKCLERGGSTYSLRVFCGDSQCSSKEFSLKKGDTLEDRTTVDLPSDIMLPAKISLVLDNGVKTEEVHFWIK